VLRDAGRDAGLSTQRWDLRRTAFVPARLGLLGMKILIVDDHALIRDALQGVLKKLQRGVTVLEASDSQQAFDIIAGNPDINLILLDLTLPGRDGLSVLAELRERYPAISVVVLSALKIAPMSRKCSISAPPASFRNRRGAKSC
jgi:CheY-like chemotaxis protein